MTSTPTIPDHHRQWFNQLLRAASDGRLGLLATTDATTGEYRSVLVLLSGPDEGNGYFVTPVGHLATTDNPYDAYEAPFPDGEGPQAPCNGTFVIVDDDDVG